MKHIYNINDLKKDYDDRTVLNIKELGISNGNITSIIGPSGSGKSTLLSILNHIEMPTSGTVVFDGSKLPVCETLDINIRRQMAMVFQKPIVFNDSVYENIAYGLKLRKVPRDVIREEVYGISETIGLKDKLKQNAKTLSGGEAQRVAIARAVILKPKVLLMDEVTTNLDPANVGIIEDLVKHANSNYKITIVLITHNMNQARRLSDEVIFLLNGSLVEFGTAEKVLNAPENKITLDFINGNMIW